MTEGAPKDLKVTTTRFGEITVPEDQVIHMPQGMVGFPGLRRYALVQHQPDSAFHWLQSLDRVDLAFVVVNPVVFKPDYQITLAGGQVKLLEVTDPGHIQVWVVVTIPKGQPQDMSANLKAPVVINLSNRKAGQLIMDDEGYSLRHPLTPKKGQGK